LTGVKKAVVLLLAAFAILFVACPTVDLSRKGVRPPTSADATASGPVAGFGDFRVAGADFADASTMVVDDLGRGIDDIAAGMITTVRGTLDASFQTGFASMITIEREMRGPASDNVVSLDNGTFRVLGRTVIVNPATVLLDAAGKDTSLGELKKGFLDNDFRPILEVHGAVQDNGAIRASYISWIQDNVVDGGNVELRGTVREINTLAHTFRIGPQTVNYMRLSASGRINWPPAGLYNGLVVDVWGCIEIDGETWVVRTRDNTDDRIAVISVGLGNMPDRIALEGYVLSGVSNLFRLSVPGGAVTVTSDAATTLSGDTFGIGKKVRVKGTLLGNDGRQVQASSVFVLKALDVLLEGPLKSLPSGGDTIALLDRTVKTDGFTMFRDPSGGVRDGFGLRSLALDNIVRVIGWVDGSVAAGNIVAARLDRIDGNTDRVSIQGPASSCNNQLSPSLQILNFTVSTNSSDIDYYDKGGVKLDDRDAFCGKLAAGAIVRVRNGVFVSAAPPRINPPTAGDRMELEIVNVVR